MCKYSKSIIVVFLFLSNYLIAQNPIFMFDEKSGQEIMLGKCDDGFLKKGIFGESYSSEYPVYITNNQIIKQIIDLLNQSKTEYEVVVILGTWCGDSKEQVPRFMKVMDSLNTPFLSVRAYVCVDRTKSAPNFSVEEYKIEKVPTFIFYKNQTEIGRIVETPMVSLEADILKILQK